MHAMTPPRALPVLREYDNWPRGPLHLVIGEFDGVHIGHQAALRALKDSARRVGATALSMHFDPIPIEYLAPAAPRSALTDAAERTSFSSRRAPMPSPSSASPMTSRTNFRSNSSRAWWTPARYAE